MRLNEPNDIAQKYADAFRELVNSKVWAKEDSPAKLLRLNKEGDWSFICVAMDIVGDSSLAIGDFLKFGLDGPTKYESTGEAYLRLYGLLTAAYIQQEALRKLFGLMNCPDSKALKQDFDKLEIRQLRHQLASHGLDFLGEDGKVTESFVPVRIDLKGFSCSVATNRGDAIKSYDLSHAIGEHLQLVISVLDSIYEKSYKTLYKAQASKQSEYQAKLVDLRFERDGNVIMRTGTGEDAVEIRWSFISPRA